MCVELGALVDRYSIAVSKDYTRGRGFAGGGLMLKISNFVAAASNENEYRDHAAHVNLLYFDVTGISMMVTAQGTDHTAGNLPVFDCKDKSTAELVAAST